MFVAVTSFWFWVNVQIWLRGPLFEVRDYNTLGYLSVLLVLLLSIISVGMIIFHRRPTNVILGLIVGVTYFLLFKISNLNLLGVFVLVLLFFHAEDLVMGEMAARIKISPWILIRKGITNFIVSFFILMSFAAYQSPAIDEFKNMEKLPSSSELFVKTVVEQSVGAQLNEATPQEKQLVLNQVSGEIIGRANTFLKPYFQYAPPALAFGLFLILWGVGWIFTLLSGLVGILIIWILKKIKFFTIEEYDVKAQRIII